MREIPTVESLRIEDQSKRILEDETEVSAALKAMSTRQQAFALQCLLNPRATDTEKARNAGYSVSEHSKVSGIKKAVAGKLGHILFEHGITQLSIVEVVADCLKAERCQAHVVRVYEDGKPVKEELVTVSLPDMGPRLRAAQILINLGGYAAPQKIHHEHEVTASFENKTIHDLRERERELQKAIKSDYEVVNDSRCG